MSPCLAPLRPPGPHILSGQPGHTPGHPGPVCPSPAVATMLRSRTVPGERIPSFWSRVLGPLARTECWGCPGRTWPQEDACKGVLAYQRGKGQAALEWGSHARKQPGDPDLKRCPLTSVATPRPGLLTRGCSEGQSLREVGLPHTRGSRLCHGQRHTMPSARTSSWVCFQEGPRPTVCRWKPRSYPRGTQPSRGQAA